MNKTMPECRDMKAHVFEIDDTWKEHGLCVLSLALIADPKSKEEEDTHRRWITEYGVFVADVSDRYMLLPNQIAFEIAEAMSKNVGARPDSWVNPPEDFEFWIRRTGKKTKKTLKHVLKFKHRLRIKYAFGDKVTINLPDGESEEVQMGYIIRNSIDASLAFSVELSASFLKSKQTFWGIRSERLIHVKGPKWDKGFWRTVLAVIKKGPQIKEDPQAKEDLQTKQAKHVVRGIEERIKKVLGYREQLVSNYRKWAKQDINEKKAEDLYNALKRVNFPKTLRPKWLQVAEVEGLEVPGREPKDHRPKIFEVYKEFLENIQDSESNYKTKKKNFEKLHRAFRTAELLATS